MRVRRKVVFDWLVFLRANHPDYRNLKIDEDNLLAFVGGWMDCGREGRIKVDGW